MKILIVAATFYPLNSPRANRTTELAKELARQGHTVTVITPKDDNYHLDFEKQYSITIKDLGKRKLKLFSSKGKGLKNILARILNRGLNLVMEYPDMELVWMVKKKLKNEQGYDLMVSIAVPHPVHWGVAAARSKKNLIATTWVADCGDPYMGNRLDSFNKLFYFKYFEKNFCAKANFISVPTKDSKGGYYSEFHEKIKVIPQGFNFKDTPVFAGEIKNEVPTFAYAGTFIPGSRDPSELLDFLCKQNKLFKFIVYTEDTALVKPYVKKSANRIEIRSYIPRKNLIYELSKMDFVISFAYGTLLVTPSKLIDYAITRRPILSLDTGKLATTIVEEFLNGAYHNKFKIENVEQYKIFNVAKAFLDLAGS